MKMPKCWPMCSECRIHLNSCPNGDRGDTHEAVTRFETLPLNHSGRNLGK